MLGEIPRMTRRRGVPFYLLVHVLYATGESTLVRDYEFCFGAQSLTQRKGQCFIGVSCPVPSSH